MVTHCPTPANKQVRPVALEPGIVAHFPSGKQRELSALMGKAGKHRPESSEGPGRELSRRKPPWLLTPHPGTVGPHCPDGGCMADRNSLPDTPHSVIYWPSGHIQGIFPL